MLIRRIRVRNFRKLADPVEIDGLGPGLTVIAGDNEAGKSTLLDAVRAAFFERHNVGGRVLDEMMPYGSAVRPEVALDFEIDGAGFALAKSFGKGASVALTTPGGRFEGPAADEKLAELLQFEVPDGRTGAEARRRSRGVLGLFWLEQGHVHHGLGLGPRGQQTIRGALEGEVGDVLGGTRGQRLLEAARRRRAELLTPTGRVTGRLQEARDTAGRARAAADEAARRLADYEAEVDRLGRLRADLAGFEAERTVEALAARAAEARAAAEALKAVEAEIAALGKDRDLAAAQAETARRHAEDRAELHAVLAEAEAAVAERAQAHAAAAEAADGWQARVRAAEDRHRAARTALAAAAATLRAAEGHARLAALHRESDALARRLSEAARWRDARAAAIAELGELRVDAKTLAGLRQLDARCGEARARREVAATRLTPHPEAGKTARLGGAALAPGVAVELTGPSEVELAGWGRLTVTPGAGDLARLAAEQASAEAARAEALGRAGMASLAAAEAALARRTEAESARRAAEQALAITAPEGIAALEDAASRVKAEVQRLAAAAPAPVAETPDPEALRTTAAAAEAEAAEAAAALDALRAAMQRHAEAAARLEAESGAARRAVGVAAGRLEAARATHSDAALDAARAEAADGLDRAEQALSEAQARRDAADPEVVRLRLARAEAAHAQALAERERLGRDARDVEMRLDGLGGSGLGEEAARTAALAGRAEDDHAALQREADALDLLVATLERAEAQAKEAFLAPVLARVAPYLRLVMPGAELRLDDGLEIAAIARDGREERFDSLSVGTREQISVLVRLAFAAYLREKGVPATVILDDTLVYADDGRFERMQLALTKAAATVQILVLTCRPRDWRGLGAPLRHLRDMVQPAQG